MRRGLWIALTVGSSVLLVAFVVGGALGWIAAPVVVIFPVMLIGARAGRVPRGILVVLGTVVTLSALSLLLLDDIPDPPRLFGLPPATWVMLVGLGLLPLWIVVQGFAATYGRPRDGSTERDPR